MMYMLTGERLQTSRLCLRYAFMKIFLRAGSYPLTTSLVSLPPFSLMHHFGARGGGGL